MTEAHRRTTKRIKQKQPAVNLTQAQAQMLIDFIKPALTDYVGWKAEANEVKEDLWKVCDPDNPASLEAFVELNRIKTMIAAQKVRFQKFVKLQKKLKAIAKNPQ